jgi:Asp-tRNA(Asn)/Glu-tRNA(Gln) amidotransferase A subunit family amidase
VGFKPTLYRIPTTGLVYFSKTVDHVGLFTQDIHSMALVASVLCQAWRKVRPPTSLPVLGIPDGPFLEQVEPEGLRAFQNQCSMLEDMGCKLKHVPSFSKIEHLNQLHRRMIFAEFAHEHREMYKEHAPLYRPRTAEIIEIGSTVDDQEVNEARSHCGKLRAELENQMAQANIDLWVCPSALGPAPEGLEITGDPNMNLPWTHAGMPVITLPAGKADNGLPLGLQFVAFFGADECLLGWCRMLADQIAPA